VELNFSGKTRIYGNQLKLLLARRPQLYGQFSNHIDWLQQLGCDDELKNRSFSIAFGSWFQSSFFVCRLKLSN